eukprot:CAMPEP_0194038864 /NCGR_PEP_ID=MMETSP0009_2-20130614/11083_1 /TAXON_ID=210454 /ORGANISM="Grammatophora oceanica, Strain CCMP 410" /LENGTH=133 /DNA_ID=CAMNT_0038681517 /DNA_START=86 /DNA_END=488 /DNA_ORIENTATION=-
MGIFGKKRDEPPATNPGAQSVGPSTDYQQMQNGEVLPVAQPIVAEVVSGPPPAKPDSVGAHHVEGGSQVISKKSYTLKQDGTMVPIPDSDSKYPAKADNSSAAGFKRHTTIMASFRTAARPTSGHELVPFQEC